MALPQKDVYYAAHLKKLEVLQLKKVLLSSFLMAGLINLGTFSAEAKNYYYKFNEKGSTMNFYIVSTLHKPVGTIKKFKGNINIKVNDKEEIEKADGILEIPVSGMVTQDNDPFTKDSDRDTRMKSEILNAKSFPAIKFKVNNAKITSNNLKTNNTLDLVLYGPLSIRGVSKNIEVPVSVRLSPDRNTAMIEGSYGVNFRDFNLPDPSLPIIGKVKDIVGITFNLKTY
jgi:polyisoprenoid-binding protein YceI